MATKVFSEESVQVDWVAVERSMCGYETPLCFRSRESFLEYAYLYLVSVKRRAVRREPVNVCEDCNPSFQYAMTKRWKCDAPSAIFVYLGDEGIAGRPQSAVPTVMCCSADYCLEGDRVAHRLVVKYDRVGTKLVRPDVAMVVQAISTHSNEAKVGWFRWNEPLRSISFHIARRYYDWSYRGTDNHFPFVEGLYGQSAV